MKNRSKMTTQSHVGAILLGILLVTLLLMVYNIGILPKLVPTQISDQMHESELKATISTQKFLNDHPICTLISSRFQSTQTSRIWLDIVDDIVNSSQLPGDADFLDREIMQSLIVELPPAFLRKGLKSRVKHSDIQLLIRKILAQKESSIHNTTAAPLRVLVMGGSVTEGSGCTIQKMDPGGYKLTHKACAWPLRLETIINGVLGFQAIKVFNMAYGGTSTGQAVDLIKYWLYPDSLLPDSPDVIIHAYGVNDNYLGRGASLFADEFDRVDALYRNQVHVFNAFLGAVKISHQCPPPPIFYLDEYIGGHAQGGLLGDLTYSSTLAQFANWYGNLAVSSADVIRHVIYANTAETNFSPHWRSVNGVFKEECHFGRVGHMLIALTFVYNLLDSVVTFCEDEDDSILLQRRNPWNVHLIDSSTAQLISSVTPPLLTSALRLENISAAYFEQKQRQDESCTRNNFSGVPCVLAWVAGPEGKTRNGGSLLSYLKPYISFNKGWGVEEDMSHGWSRKLGFVAKESNATLTLDILVMKAPLRMINLVYLKSYGEKWADSRARFTISVDAQSDGLRKTIMDFELEGFHNSTSSISYSYGKELSEDDVVYEGKKFRLSIELIGGTTFKLTGMMFCSR